MIPNNNISALPWYTSIEQQNARKWWVYDRVYPLFTPAGFLLPFQITRNALNTFSPNAQLQMIDQDTGALLANGDWDDTIGGSAVSVYEIPNNCHAIYVENLPEPVNVLCVSFVALDVDDEIIGINRPQFDSSHHFTGGWELPDGTRSIRVNTYVEQYEISGFECEVFSAIKETANVQSFKVYQADGTLVGDYTPAMRQLTYIKQVADDKEVLIYTGQFPICVGFPNGQYYAVLSDGVNTWYSEIFTVVNDIAPYLKIQWWDVEDFVMDAGTIVYTNPAFKNVLYLDADLAKPEYLFEEEGETRDGYFFPIKQISEKHYRFKFFASEYLLDVMRFIRMADYAVIEYHGQTYNLDTFLITPEWEDNGDVASVEAEFDTATVAKKIGRGYTEADKGDFNNDFNDDFNNQ